MSRECESIDERGCEPLMRDSAKSFRFNLAYPANLNEIICVSGETFMKIVTEWTMTCDGNHLDFNEVCKI